MITVMMDSGETNRSYSSIQPPPWNLLDEPSFNFYGNGGSILQNHNEEPDQSGVDEFDIPIDEFSSDRFRMYEYKVKKCARGRSHDWTDCPFAHPGEKARRRDPTKHSYSGSICPEFRKGQCRKGDGCEFAHGVFECWLHPSRYRTQPCKDGTHCRRPVCFFAHTPEQLRVVPLSEPFDAFLDSAPQITDHHHHHSPPVSPVGSLQFKLVNELASSIRNLHLSQSFKIGSGGFSPRSPLSGPGLQHGFSSLPCTPTRYGVAVFDSWDNQNGEPAATTTPTMERVESGKSLRAKMYAKLSMENPLNQGEPDVGWISELLG